MRTVCSLSLMMIVAALCAAGTDQPVSPTSKKPRDQAQTAAPAQPKSAPAEKQPLAPPAEQPQAEPVGHDGSGKRPSKYPEEEKPLLKSAEAFVKAYGEHDAKAVAALFAPEAEYIDAEGHEFQGREVIEQTLADFFKENPDSSLLLDVASIRFLSPTLAIEEGLTVCTVKRGGRPEASRYVAIHTKADGQWLIASIREHSARAPAGHAAHLKQLNWLVGNWVDEDRDSVVHFNCRPSENGNFLIRDFEVVAGGGKVVSGTQRFGWDPLSGKFRAWTFDDDGGYFEGWLTREGDDWVLMSAGVTAYGQAASGTTIFTLVNDQTITWRVVDREINGSPLEDSDEFTLVKKGPPPQHQAPAPADTQETGP